MSPWVSLWFILASLSHSWWFCASRGKLAPQQTASWPELPRNLWGSSCRWGRGRSEPRCCSREGWSEEGRTSNSEREHRLKSANRDSAQREGKVSVFIHKQKWQHSWALTSISRWRAVPGSSHSTLNFTPSAAVTTSTLVEKKERFEVLWHHPLSHRL